jgi:hypothetical protein
MTKDEALKMAVEIMERYLNETPLGNQPHMIAHKAEKAINACKEALEQPAQEPVAWMNDIAYSDEIDNLPANRGEIFALYSRPHQWQGLTDKEIFNLSQQCDLNHILGLIDYGRAIEAKLKEKNT